MFDIGSIIVEVQYDSVIHWLSLFYKWTVQTFAARCIVRHTTKSNYICIDRWVSFGVCLLFQVQTQVASLTLFTCDGQELSVADLPPDDLVNMHIPHQDLNSQVCSCSLYSCSLY